MQCIPTFNIAGGFARGYHTIVQRPRKIPASFLPILHTYIVYPNISFILLYYLISLRQKKQEAMRMWDTGKEDESLELSDIIMVCIYFPYHHSFISYLFYLFIY